MFSKRGRVKAKKPEQEGRDTDRKQMASKTFTGFLK